VTFAQRLPRGVPEAHGIPSAALLAFVDAADRTIRDLHSLMLVRHGHVVAEGWWAPYGPAQPHLLFSLSKSVTATAIGLAVAEGRLSVEAPVLSFFPDDRPATVSPNLAAMRVRHLLSMATGHAEDTFPHLRRRPDGHWVRAFLERPVEYAPGTRFLYNTGATYMLSAILQALTGQPLLDYLRPRLLAPLGIADATWETCPRGIAAGGTGLSLRTEDIACFGQLYLQRGWWAGRRLLPEAWVAEATGHQIATGSRADSDWEQGYGYQFWRCRHAAYRGDGAFGQFCVVMPDQDAVLAITAGVAAMQPVLDLVWAELLPALGAAPLPAAPDATAALTARLARLALRPPAGAAAAAGLAGATYHFEPNEQQAEAITFDFGDAGGVVTLRDRQGVHRIAYGGGAWRNGVTTLAPAAAQPGMAPAARPIAAAGAWPAADTFVLQVWFTETPFCLTLTCRFAGRHLLLDGRLNAWFGPTERPRLVGRRGEPAGAMADRSRG
jgi:CubicO group peptidase (beta-lactamase class C family)